MPALLRVGSYVSSLNSKTASWLPLPEGKKRRVRERVFGVIVNSVQGGKWEVLWDSLEVEELAPGVLKRETDPTPDTLEIVEIHKGNR